MAHRWRIPALLSLALLPGCDWGPFTVVKLVNKSGEPVTGISIDFPGAFSHRETLLPGASIIVRGKPNRDGLLILRLNRGDAALQLNMGYNTHSLDVVCAVTVLDTAIEEQCGTANGSLADFVLTMLPETVLPSTIASP